MRLPCTQSKHIQLCTVTLLPPTSLVTSVSSTEYTQGGNGRFLACIPSWWKNRPWLVRVGGGCMPTPFHSIYHHVQSCSTVDCWFRNLFLTTSLRHSLHHSLWSTHYLNLPYTVVPHWNENPIYVFLFWELRGLSPNFHIHETVSDLYIHRIGPATE